MNSNSINDKINNGSEESFVEILEESLLTKVVKILESRLPRSGHVYNMALLMPKFQSTVKLYALNKDLSEKAVLVFIAKRQDFEQDIDISVPLDFKVNDAQVKEAFIHTKIFDWKKKYLFTALDRLISPMIVEISTIVKGNASYCRPNFYYYMNREDASSLLINQPEDPRVELRPLDKELGSDFITKNWNHASIGSVEYIQELIEKNPSSGVHLDGIPVSGVCFNVHGLVGMLHTAKEHRGKRYAQMCMLDLLKQLGNNGLAPSSCVEQNNLVSRTFHEKMGMKYSHTVDYIFYFATGF